jgi:rRNA-processing protein FCF1
VIKYKQGQENVVTNALSRRYVLLNTLYTKLLGFEYIKELHLDDNDCGFIYDECKVSTKDRFFKQDGFLFKENKLCVPNCFMRELLIREAHGGGLIGQVSTKDRFFKQDGFLFKENKLCVPNCFMRELLVREAHEGGLIGHFRIAKTLDVLHEHFY